MKALTLFAACRCAECPWGSPMRWQDILTAFLMLTALYVPMALIEKAWVRFREGRSRESGPANDGLDDDPER